jgi:hypothetical protein
MLAVLGGTGFLIQSGFLRHARDDQTHKTTHQVIPSLAHPNPPKPLRLLARSAETPSLQELHSHNLPTGHFTVTISRQVVMSRPNTMREMIETSHQVIPSLARPNPPKPLRLLARSAETPSLQDTSGECGAAEGRGRGRCTHCVSMAQMPMAQMPEHAHTDCLRHHVFVWVRFLIFGGGWCGQISDSGPFLIGIFLFGHGERRRRYRIS